eukprot:5378026-Pleurochrysis_carterae.AAC.3
MGQDASNGARCNGESGCMNERRCVKNDYGFESVRGGINVRAFARACTWPQRRRRAPNAAVAARPCRQRYMYH